MKTYACLIAMAAGLGVAAPASAQVNPVDILRKYESKYTNYQGVYAKMQLHMDGQMKAVVETRSRANGQRLMKLLYPGDVKGMHILVQSKNEMYIYLPAFRKVRRIAGHVRNQGFLGSGFTYDDMAINLWSKSHVAKLVGETRTHWRLELKAIPGKTVLYPHIRLHIRKDLHLCDRFEYLNQDGRTYKTQLFERYKCVEDGSYCMPMRIVMLEHTRGNRRSELRVVKYRKRGAYPDRMFTVRHLLRAAD